MRPAKIVSIVFGALFVLIGLALLVPGIVLLGAYGALKDDAGFLQTSTRAVETDGYALVSPHIELNIGPNGWQWLPKGSRLGFRILASSSSSQAVFVGIGPSDKVAEYLKGVAHDEITEYRWTSSSVKYRRLDGGAPSSRPSAQTFWVASQEGPGQQDLRWDMLDGDWTAVIMNADASAPVAANMSLGARLGILLPIGIGMTVVGVVLLAVGILLIVLGVRRRHPEAIPQPPAGWGPPPAGWGPPPAGWGQQPQQPGHQAAPGAPWQQAPYGAPQPVPAPPPAEPGAAPGEQRGGEKQG